MKLDSGREKQHYIIIGLVEILYGLRMCENKAIRRKKKLNKYLCTCPRESSEKRERVGCTSLFLIIFPIDRAHKQKKSPTKFPSHKK